MHHHHHSSRPSPLEVRQLAEFDATLGDIPEEERRRKRIAYLADAARQVDIGASLMKGFGCFLIPFAVIPLFWPFLAFFWYMRKKASEMMQTQLSGALGYWGIREDELPGHRDSERAQGPAYRRL